MKTQNLKHLKTETLCRGLGFFDGEGDSFDADADGDRADEDGDRGDHDDHGGSDLEQLL